MMGACGQLAVLGFNLEQAGPRLGEAQRDGGGRVKAASSKKTAAKPALDSTITLGGPKVGRPATSGLEFLDKH
jgi:hypothetical protein